MCKKLSVYGDDYIKSYMCMILILENKYFFDGELGTKKG